MPDNKNGQPRWRVIGAKMPIGLAAPGALIYDFEIAMQYAALAAARAPSQRASQDGDRGRWGFLVGFWSVTCHPVSLVCQIAASFATPSGGSRKRARQCLCPLHFLRAPQRLRRVAGRSDGGSWMPLESCGSRSLSAQAFAASAGLNLNAGRIHPDLVDAGARRNEQRLPVGLAETNIGRLLGRADRTEVLAFG
jgi:hypothetical protein